MTYLVRAIVVMVALGVTGMLTSSEASSSRVVPTAYPTIQAAIDAAQAGDTISVLAGTYTEQLRISKSLEIVGAGVKSTIIRAPSKLRQGELHDTSIVEIFGGASVSMSRLTVSGPGSGTCKKGALTAGIRVHGTAHLGFSFGAVRDIHDSPMAGCFHSGTGILVGEVPAPPASLDIRYSEITNYQSSGIVVLGFGSTANITYNTVVGPGPAGGVATDGIEFPVGSVGTIAHNTVSGNICPPTDPGCGPDWFTQFQHAGILAGGWGPGTVVTNNLTFGNQVGMLLGESDEISHNRMVDNDFFGLGLFDGTFLIDGAQISGGGGGVWVIADSADSTVTLKSVTFSGLSGPAVEEVECCGFTATVIGGP
ncbi:MAG: hypothetical protein DMD81_04160 [Candidatus Rokuibacteriota bacterium]|nr:MAG: hypothetical protein DMD81_04160 [Candidatus Rokubacteria bacterium]